jgi:hypothetical protein
MILIMSMTIMNVGLKINPECTALINTNKININTSRNNYLAMKLRASKTSIKINLKVQQGLLVFHLRHEIGSIGFLARWQNVRSRFRNGNWQAHTSASRMCLRNNFLVRSIAVGHEQALVHLQLRSLHLLQDLHRRAQIYSISNPTISGARRSDVVPVRPTAYRLMLGSLGMQAIR